MAITLLMKWRMLQAVILHPAMKPSAGVVAARLLHHLNTTNLRCNPSYATIADATGISRDTVMSGVKDLERAGFLKVDRSIEPGERAAKGQRLPSNGFEFDWRKIGTQSEKATTPSRKSRPSQPKPQSEFPTTQVDNSDYPQSEKPVGGSRKFRPKQGKEETENLETGKLNLPAVAGQLALLDQSASDVVEPKQPRANGKKWTRTIKTELPLEWVLSDQQWNYGAKLGLTGPEIEESQRRLKSYVKSEGLRKADWNAYVESWLDREKNFAMKSRSHSLAHDPRAGFEEFLNGDDRHG